jgi:hypothetical protein
MPDDPTKRGGMCRSRIDFYQEHQLRSWCDRFRAPAADTAGQESPDDHGDAATNAASADLSRESKASETGGPS